jgi:hypothetical protein|tara:strand:+ start:2161 stop:2346 length:186 start_codon:yes stop_codon:yes gene_type:complete
LHGAAKLGKYKMKHKAQENKIVHGFLLIYTLHLHKTEQVECAEHYKPIPTIFEYFADYKGL